MVLLGSLRRFSVQMCCFRADRGSNGRIIAMTVSKGSLCGDRDGAHVGSVASRSDGVHHSVDIFAGVGRVWRGDEPQKNRCHSGRSVSFKS